MKRAYTFKIDCANCAMKVENAIKEIDGVENVKISYMAEKMMLTAPDEIFDKVFDEALKAAKKIEPDCEIVR